MEDPPWPVTSGARLVQMLERLPAYRGVLSARAASEQEQPGTVSGVTVGPRSGSDSVAISPSTGSHRDDVERIESTGRNLTGHPALAGLVDYVQV